MTIVSSYAKFRSWVHNKTNHKRKKQLRLRKERRERKIKELHCKTNKELLEWDIELSKLSPTDWRRRIIYSKIKNLLKEQKEKLDILNNVKNNDSNSVPPIEHKSKPVLAKKPSISKINLKGRRKYALYHNRNRLVNINHLDVSNWTRIQTYPQKRLD